MQNNPYIGHASQLAGVEEHRLVGGKGDGMRLFQVRNGKGLEFTVSADRCADISRLSFLGQNMCYISPSGYVAPQYFEEDGLSFLKSFTCGFLTTCGLHTIGNPSEDNGVSYGLHGTISHIPAENIYYTEDDEALHIHATMQDGEIFKHKLTMERVYTCSKKNNELHICDRVINNGSAELPLMILYHFNLGYPLVDEHAILEVSSNEVMPRDDHAKKGLDEWMKLIPPQPGFQEQCYYHHFNTPTGTAKIFNPAISRGLSMQFDRDTLERLVEWKMMGEKDYVLGLEPSNHALDGRKELNQKNQLKVIKPGETIEFNITLNFFDDQDAWKSI